MEGCVTDWIMAVLTLIIAFFTFLVWKVYDRIAWLTGAMGSHSEIMLRIGQITNWWCSCLREKNKGALS